MTAPDPDPHESDAERSPEDLGPHLQSELDELLSGLDDDEVVADAQPDAGEEQPASALPKQPADSDDLGPHLQAQLHELLGEESALGDHSDEGSNLESVDERTPAEVEGDADLAALEALEALNGGDELAGDGADVEAELDAFLAEGDDELYDDGITDAVSLDDYDAQRDRGELQDLGFKDDQLGLAWDEETELADEQGALGELQSQLDAGEELLGADPAPAPAPVQPEEPSDAFDALGSEEESTDGDELADLIDDLEANLGEDAPVGEPEAPASAEAPELEGSSASDLAQAEPADAPEPQGLGQDLFEEAPQRSLDEALAAEDFDLDEDLFDFASLESGGGLAADDALDIEEFLEAVGDGESFGSVDSDAVESLGGVDDLLTQASEDQALAQQDSPAIDSIDAELAAAESQAGPAAPVAAPAAQAPQPGGVQGQLVVASGGHTWAWWLAGVAILVGTNLAVVTFLQADRDIARHNLEAARASLVEATSELNDLRAADKAFLTDLRTPLALPEVDPTSAFAQVHEALDGEDFELARRRLYALLATVDRRETPEERETIEAHAAFMLADVDRLEADALGERP